MELVVDNVETIKWLLVVIVIISSLFLVVFSFGVLLLKIIVNTVVENNINKVFRVLSDKYLAKNSIDKLLSHCEARIITHPNDVYAHWYLGQAQYHDNNWHDSKRSFERALELEPSWYSTIESCLEKLEEKISEAGPKLVE